ncbi:MAG: hypothetical protein CVT99_06505 [Bacteroidetes bacterium HGW-Bacteroidetes-16]|nr:MAG: hypothetical protein CVT99_06505 [Bacteroidetes bacterium HGW-Bacteroidetes-16]
MSNFLLFIFSDLTHHQSWLKAINEPEFSVPDKNKLLLHEFNLSEIQGAIDFKIFKYQAGVIRTCSKHCQVN